MNIKLIFFWIVNIFLLVFGLPVLIFLTLLAPRYTRYLAVFWARALLWIAGFRVKINGAENIPNTPVLIAANHTSFFDILLTLGYLPARFNFVMKKELFKIPFFGQIVRILGYFPIDRKNARNAAKSLQELADFLRNGNNVLIFPEGTRNKPQNKNLPLLPFKSGMARTSFLAQTPVLPVGLDCFYARQKKWRFGKFLSLTIGQPQTPPATDERAELQKFTENISRRLENILA